MSSYRSAKDTSAIAEMKLDIQRLIRAEHNAKKKAAALVSVLTETDPSREISRDIPAPDQSSTTLEPPLFPALNAMGNVGTGSRGIDSIPRQTSALTNPPRPEWMPEDTVIGYLKQCADAAAKLTADIEKAISKWNETHEYQPRCLTPAFRDSTTAIEALLHYEENGPLVMLPPPSNAPSSSEVRESRSVVYRERVTEREKNEQPRKFYVQKMSYRKPKPITDYQSNIIQTERRPRRERESLTQTPVGEHFNNFEIGPYGEEDRVYDRQTPVPALRPPRVPRLQLDVVRYSDRESFEPELSTSPEHTSEIRPDNTNYSPEHKPKRRSRGYRDLGMRSRRLEIHDDDRASVISRPHSYARAASVGMHSGDDAETRDEQPQIIDNSSNDISEDQVGLVDPLTLEATMKPIGIHKRPSEKFPEPLHAMSENVSNPCYNTTPSN